MSVPKSLIRVGDSDIHVIIDALPPDGSEPVVWPATVVASHPANPGEWDSVIDAWIDVDPRVTTFRTPNIAPNPTEQAAGRMFRTGIPYDPMRGGYNTWHKARCGGSGQGCPWCDK